jgi:hypothetical protein
MFAQLTKSSGTTARRSVGTRLQTPWSVPYEHGAGIVAHGVAGGGTSSIRIGEGILPEMLEKLRLTVRLSVCSSVDRLAPTHMHGTDLMFGALVYPTTRRIINCRLHEVIDHRRSVAASRDT